jgi:hypothetical protein
LKFKTYNSYRVLVRMVCETGSGCICDVEMCVTERKKLQNTVPSILDKYVTPYSLVNFPDISEERAASIFKAEEYKAYIAFIHSQST